MSETSAGWRDPRRIGDPGDSAQSAERDDYRLSAMPSVSATCRIGVPASTWPTASRLKDSGKRRLVWVMNTPYGGHYPP